MARRKYEFRPDKQRTDLLGKLYLPPQQRRILLRWVLYAVLLVTASVVQDVVLCKLTVFGASTDLVPCAIILICVQIGADRGAIFSLIAASSAKVFIVVPPFILQNFIHEFWGLEVYCSFKYSPIHC